jgi:hypothetical protein
MPVQCLCADPILPKVLVQGRRDPTFIIESASGRLISAPKTEGRPAQLFSKLPSNSASIVDPLGPYVIPVERMRTRSSANPSG